MICVCCGDNPATHEWSGEPHCWPCVVSGMAYGHQHVHDDASDCTAWVARLSNSYTSGSDVVQCPNPMD